MDAAPPAVAQLRPMPPPPGASAAPPPNPTAGATAATRAAVTGSALRITFPPGNAELSQAGTAAIRHLVGAAPAGGTTTFNVNAYAAATPGDPSDARRLSLSRGLAVRKALIADGVDSSRILVRALGSQAEHGPADRADVTLLGGNDPAVPQR